MLMMSSTAPARPHTVSTILCCECGVTIKPNTTNMCVNCLRSKVDITEGIEREQVVFRCRGCLRFRRQAAWVDCPLESRELLAICLEKLRQSLKRVKLVDAKFLWTEPVSSLDLGSLCCAREETGAGV